MTRSLSDNTPSSSDKSFSNHILNEVPNLLPFEQEANQLRTEPLNYQLTTQLMKDLNLKRLTSIINDDHIGGTMCRLYLADMSHEYYICITANFSCEYIYDTDIKNNSIAYIRMNLYERYISQDHTLRYR